MSNKQRQLRVSGLDATSNIEVLREHFERYGPVQTCFKMGNSVNQAIVTMKQLDDVLPAINGMDGFNFNGRRITVTSTIDYKKGKGSSSTSNSLSTASVNGKNWGADTGGWGQSDPSTSSNARAGFPSNPSPNATTSSNALAPAPRVVAPNIASTGDQQIDGLTNGLANMLDGGKDTWEISLEDSDYDDGWQPRKIDNRPKPIQKDEWYEAYDFVKSFAHYGGAMLAVDVESWDRDQDYIIELGLAYVTWQKGNLAPPRVRAEHISKLRKAHDCFHACLVTKMTCLVIEEHKDKRNGLYSPDAKDRFAYGKSRTLTEFESQVRLRMIIQKLGQGINGQKQPVVFLFHNATAEKNYFQLMNIDVLDNAPERIPNSLRQPTAASFKKGDWSGYVILDTQRLWKAFLIGTGQEKDAPLALGKICKSLGVTTKYLHNAGNDALYTLKVFMKLAESESQSRRLQREEASNGSVRF